MEATYIHRSVGDYLATAFQFNWPEIVLGGILFALALWRSKAAYFLVPLGLVASYLHLDDYYEPTIYGAMEADLGPLATPTAWAVAALYLLAPCVGAIIHRWRRRDVG